MKERINDYVGDATLTGLYMVELRESPCIRLKRQPQFPEFLNEKD